MIPLTLDFARESGTVSREIIRDPDFLEKALADPTFENAVVGTGSIYNIKTKTVFLYPEHLQDGTLFTCQSIARKIIENALKSVGRKRYPANKNLDWSDLLSPPQYCFPCSGDLIYIDLRSAYWQVYQRLPLFPREVRGDWNNAPPFLSDFLPPDLREYKLIRNALGGIWRANVSTKIKSGKLVRERRFFPTTSFDSWQLLQTFLHTLGKIAVRMGAYYVNNDGYIFRYRGYWEEFLDFLDSHGFQWEIKAVGSGEIRGIGQYSIGGLQTKRLARGRFLDKLDSINPNVLKLRRTITTLENEKKLHLQTKCRTPEPSDFPF